MRIRPLKSASTFHRDVSIIPTGECASPVRRRPPLMGVSAELSPRMNENRVAEISLNFSS